MTKNSKNATAARAKWDATSEDILIEGVKKAVASGIKADKNFKPQVYQSIASDLAKAGYCFDACQVKSRWNRFKASWKTVNFLRSLSGFGWDEDKKCVTATEDVWKALLYNEDGSKKKKFEEYHYFKTHNFPYYNDINALVGDNAAQGDQAFSSTSGSDASSSWSTPIFGSQEDDTSQAVDLDGTSPAVLDGSQSTDDGLAQSTPTQSAGSKHKSTPPTTPVKKRSRPTSAAQIGQLVDSVNRLVSGLISPSKGLTPRTRKIRKEAVWNTIKKEEGLSPHSLAKARRVLNGGDDVIEDYLSFDGNNEEEREARAFWLADAMDNLK
ncbi:hypothetical protein F5880DRAFT_1576553 [Lentinula raphanica]|nr:hypothetical protein F5880DRAFT_1576553 [Lentinula raphanica]